MERLINKEHLVQIILRPKFLTKQENSRGFGLAIWHKNHSIESQEENFFLKEQDTLLFAPLPFSSKALPILHVCYGHSQGEQEAQTDLFTPEHPGERGQWVDSNRKIPAGNSRKEKPPPSLSSLFSHCTNCKNRPSCNHGPNRGLR